MPKKKNYNTDTKQVLLSALKWAAVSGIISIKLVKTFRSVKWRYKKNIS